MKKKLLSLALALVLCLSLLPATALAAEDFTIENGVLTRYNGSGGAVTIPSGVTSIGEDVFSNCSSLTSVSIPSSVTSIGENAFCYSGLTSVTIPSGVTSIGDYAFGSCHALDSINVDADNSVYSSEDGVLFNKNRTTLIQYPAGRRGEYSIPSGVTSIGDSAFNDCDSLTSVSIPSSVTSIEDMAFNRCDNLNSINVDSSNSKYSSENGVLFNKNKTSLIQYPAGRAGTYSIPSGVTSVYDGAFYAHPGLTGVTIPSSVTSIGVTAFAMSKKLSSVSISSGVTSIGNSAFYGCSALTSLSIPSSVISFGRGAFRDCVGLTSVSIPV